MKDKFKVSSYSAKPKFGGRRSLEKIKKDFARGYYAHSGEYGTSDNVHPLSKKKEKIK